MTPTNICNMALIKGLDIIAVTDHNSTRQLAAFSEAGKIAGVRTIYGAELQTSEEVHVLALFTELCDALAFQPWIDSVMPNVPNRTDFFGNQWICGDEDSYIEQEDRLLLVSLSTDLDKTVEAIHEHGGKAILAHVLHRENSVTNQLGFIPPGLPYDGLEIKSPEEKERVLSSHPWIKESDTLWFIDSDAHRLIEIAEPEHELTDKMQKMLFGE